MSRVLMNEKYDKDAYDGITVGPNPMSTPDHHELLLRPILVGYAFGPKKMSTMSLVMAEASKAVSTVAIITTNDIPTLIRTRTGYSDNANHHYNHHNSNSNSNNIGWWYDEQSMEAKSQGNTCETATLTSNWSCDQYSKHHRFQNNHIFNDETEIMNTAEGEDEEEEEDQSLEVQQDDGDDDDDDDDRQHEHGIQEDDHSIHSFNPYFISPYPHKESPIYIPLCCCDDVKMNSHDFDNNNNPLLVQNISKIYRSSSSSAANSTFDELSISTTTIPVFQFSSNTISSTSSPSLSTYKSDLLHYHRINISFVPLDLDFPLEEQHGGKFDVILHKMTEDISSLVQNLLKSKDYSTSMNAATLPTTSTMTDSSSILTSAEEVEEDDPHDAFQRVLRLVQYTENHIESVLMDHPHKIQHLMSRADISFILSSCLARVVSKSGLPVNTPRYYVVLGHKLCTSTHLNPSMGICKGTFSSHQKEEEEEESKEISRLIDYAGLKYPLIAKPLAAAGTKHSHKMVIILSRDGLYKISKPCLIQEYVNHDAVLYKVYVLGDRVFVYPRASLPNLPQEECDSRTLSIDDDPEYITPFVEFDSQESYPTLNEFRHRSLHRNRDRFLSHNLPCTEVEDCEKESTSKKFTPLITAEEVQPIADALRHAFGLELFGFDILMTDKKIDASSEGDIGKQLLVVDVNYFPSYKEVPDFAPLLARYLAKRAIENRIKSVLS